MRLYVYFSFLVLITPSFIIQAATCQYLGENSNPKAQYDACPESNAAAYNFALQQYFLGNEEEAFRIYTKHGGNDSSMPLKQLATLFPLTEPHQLVSTLTESMLKDWHLNFKVPTFNETAPNKPNLPALPKLIKDEFETTKQFKERVNLAKKQRQKNITSIEQAYTAAVKKYNSALQIHQQENKDLFEQHVTQTPEKRLTFLEMAYTQVFGEPTLEDPQYNADKELFYARLVARDGVFDQPVTIPVKLSEARNFKENIEQSVPQVSMSLVDGKLKVEKIQITHAGVLYAVNLTSDYYQNEKIIVTLQDEALPTFDQVKLLAVEPINDKLSQEESAFFDEAIVLENDPELAALRQKQAEISRKKRELQQVALRDKYIAKAKAQLKKQQAELTKLSQGTVLGLSIQAKRLMAELPKAKKQNNNDIAIIIGNRNYASNNVSLPNVDYALNDAQVMKHYASKTLGIMDDNIIYLEDATQSQLVSVFGNEKNYKGQLNSMLKPNQSNVFIFYSGHGVPGLSDQRGYLLPVDANPSTVELNGYALDTLYSNLGQMPAKHFNVFLDACFSGSSQSGLLIKNASPALLKLKEQPIVSHNTSVFSAANGSQVASWDTEARLGLFTHFVMKGLVGKAEINGDDSITGQELTQFLSDELPLQARRLYNREQNPTLTGDSNIVLTGQ